MSEENIPTRTKHKRSSRRRRPTTPSSPMTIHSDDSFYLSDQSLHPSNRLLIGRVRSLDGDDPKKNGNSGSHRRSTSLFNGFQNYKKNKRVIIHPFSSSNNNAQPHHHTLSHSMNSKPKRYSPRSTKRIVYLLIFFSFSIYFIFFLWFPLPSLIDSTEVKKQKSSKSNVSHHHSDIGIEYESQRNTDVIKNSRNSRLARTRPPPPPFASKTGLPHLLHTISLDPLNLQLRPKKESTIDLCGNLVWEIDAESRNDLHVRPLNSKSEVLITGILSPVGFHLALALHRQCKVNKIIGFDTMLPNTILHRLDLLNRIGVLVKKIPVLHQPIQIPYVGLSPKLKESSSKKEEKDLDFIEKYHPTHIVHLGALDGAYDGSAMEVASGSGSVYGPGRPMLALRQSMLSMEQILKSINHISDQTKRPSFTFGSTTQWSEKRFYGASKVTDEMLAHVYKELYNIESVGLRFEKIYGPWGNNDFLDPIIQNETSTLNSESLFQEKKFNDGLNWIYVDDAVDQLIAAMQMQSGQNYQSLVLQSGMKTASIDDLRARAWKILDEFKMRRDSIYAKENLSALQESGLESKVKETMTWQVQKLLPYGPAPNKKEMKLGYLNDFLHNNTSCSLERMDCRSELSLFPCASECVESYSRMCLPSVFDKVLHVSQKLSVDCNIVLYTSFLDLEDDDTIQLESMVQPTTSYADKKICNIAFISKYHEIVQKKTLSYAKTKSKAGKSQEDYFNRLNGQITEKGWNLVLIEGEKDGKMKKLALSHADRFLMKLSPSKLFSSTVKHIIFTDALFPAAPKIDDVLFLSHSMYRKEHAERSIYVKSPEGEKIKVRMPKQREKRAVFLASPKSINKSASLREVVSRFKEDNGIDPDSKDPVSLTKQRDFYDKISSYLNREDLRPVVEPAYHFEMKHWIRSKWVVHDIREEEGRQFRCDWYKEHILWENELDQLSFSYITARKDLEWKFARDEMDDREIEELRPLEPWEEALLDEKDWLPLLTAQGGVKPQIRRISDGEEPLIPIGTGSDGVELHVRLINENIMTVERKEFAEQLKRSRKKHKND